jgi:hypothetical protein
MKCFPLLHFPKIAPSSLPNRRVHSRAGLLRFFVGRQLRLPPVPTLWFHTTSPAYSSSILSALLQRLTTLGFIVVSPAPPKPKFRWLLLKKLRDSRDAFLPFEAFPPPIAHCRWTLRRRLATRAVHAGRLSPPARLSPCSAARLTPSLEAHESCRPEGPLNPHPKRSPASKVHQPPYRPVVHSLQEVAFPLHVRPRGLSPSSGPLRGRRFRLPCPVLPWAWAPRCARHVPEGPHVFAKRSQYVKDRFLRTRLSAC